MKHHNIQMSESIEVGAVLAIAGGFMDTYSYMCRDKVFANAQTGNILLFGINLAEKNWSMAIRYFFPIISFSIGIAIAEFVQIAFKNKKKIHWRQISVLFECIALCAVGFIPETWNLMANCITSMACGIQVQSFRKIMGNSAATTMCIGNIRSATQHICDYICYKDKQLLSKGLLYYGVIFCFVIGALLGNFCIKNFGLHSIWWNNLILLFALLMMMANPKERL